MVARVNKRLGLTERAQTGSNSYEVAAKRREMVGTP